MQDNASIIKNRVSITDIINRYGIEIKKGNFISCPFHGTDKTPSMKIYSKTNTVKCFGGCGFSGDVIAFVQKQENCNFQTAIALIDIWFSLGLQKPLSEEQKKEFGRKQREKEKQRLKALEMAKFERKVFDEVIAEIRNNEATIAKCKPYTRNYIAYAETKDCERYLDAFFRLRFLEWLFYILLEDSNGYLNEDFVEYTIRYGNKKAEILRKIYKGDIKI